MSPALPASASLYQAVMGDAFAQLAPALQQFHACAGRHVFHGEVQVEAPASLPARLLALLLGAPLQASRGPIRFELQAEPMAETWTRFFPDKTMRSTMRLSGGHITERLGAARLRFVLAQVEGALEMRLAQLHFLGIPCPAWLMPRITARETGAGQRLHFQVEAHVAWIGKVTGYTGHLNIVTETAP